MGIGCAWDSLSAGRDLKTNPDPKARSTVLHLLAHIDLCQGRIQEGKALASDLGRALVEGGAAERARRRLRDYVRQAWHVVEPSTPYVHGWHIDAMCEHLEAVTAGEILNLLITVPPRHMKSLTVAVFGPTWHWQAPVASLLRERDRYR